MKNRNTIFTTILLMLASIALSPPNAFGVLPAPDGGYPNNNTAEGDFSLQLLTSGADNTAIGTSALYSNTDGNENTAIGVDALVSNTQGDNNTASGMDALFTNTLGYNNTASGFSALFNNTTGSYNTASGYYALFSNTIGNYNTASGYYALNANTIGNSNSASGEFTLYSNTTGNNNTASGPYALFGNTTGNFNTAIGQSALVSNTNGNNNTASGYFALFNSTTGSSNIALGDSAGLNLTTGSNNIDIGNKGVAGESNTIRIGKKGTQTTTFIAGISGKTVANGVGVIINSNGQLGTIQSSARYKTAVTPMNEASEVILALKPVTFRYKKELDPEKIPQFGLIAEEVEKVNPDLVALDEEGKPYTVRYEAVNAMLLNEFLKEHRKVEQQEATISDMRSAIAKHEATNARQQKQIEELNVGLRKVSDKLELKQATPKLVNSH
jgi:Chaperone of endosialidase